MRLERLCGIPARCLFFSFLNIAIFTCASSAQDTPPAHESPQVQDTPQQQDARPEAPQQQAAEQPAPPPKGDAQEELQINDRTRTFVVHLPQGYDSQQRYPVAILLHGLDQNAAEMARLTHFNELADRDSIIAVYPNALGGRWTVGGVF